MEEYRIFLMEQQGWYIPQSNNLQQYDNRITSAPLGRCREIINMIFSNEKEKTKLFSLTTQSLYPYTPCTENDNLEKQKHDC